MNASPSDQPGTHWLLSLKLEGRYSAQIFSGKRLYDYHLVNKNMRRTFHRRIQLLMKKQIETISRFSVMRTIYVTHVIIENEF